MYFIATETLFTILLKVTDAMKYKLITSKMHAIPTAVLVNILMLRGTMLYEALHSILAVILVQVLMLRGTMLYYALQQNQ